MAALTKVGGTLRTALAPSRLPAPPWPRLQRGPGPPLPSTQRLRRIVRGWPVQSVRSVATGVSSTPLAAAPKLSAYLDILLRENQNLNLTAPMSRDEASVRHVGDSYALLDAVASYTDITGPLQVLDVGSGAGFPGVVLAAACPHWQVTVLDSLRKRCLFVDKATQACGIDNVTVVWARAEAAGQDPAYRQAFDVVVARAVAELRVLAELCLPFVRLGGWFFAPKGPHPEEEVQAALHAINVLGGQVVATDMVASESMEGMRTVVVVRKVTDTPAKYPRREGRPSKQPLQERKTQMPAAS